VTTSRRTRACALPAAALAAALVLTPAAAFAADGDVPASSSAVDESAEATAPVSPAVDELAPEPTDSGVGQVAADEAPEAPEASEPGGSAGDVEEAPAAPSAVAPTQAAVPEQAPELAPGDGGDEVVIDEPAVFSMDGGVLHPGFAQFFGTSGFTPGDLVGVTVTGSEGQDLSEWAQTIDGLGFAVDGDAYFTVLVPVGFAAPGVVTLTVSDESGNQASLAVPVEAFVAAPHLEPPVSATAGVVSIQGQNGEPGQVALVSSSRFDGPEPDQGVDDGAAEEADGVELVTVPDGEVRAERPEFVTDDAPVTYYPERDLATALVAIDEDGDFTASFVLPAGEYVSDAAVIRRDGTVLSDFSVPVRFSVSAAVAPVVPVVTAPVVPAAATPVAVVPVRAARPAGLAYTGSDASAWLALAAGLVAAGSVAVAASRLRGRRS